jgi:uncharacterized protein (DUF697 family)
MHNLSNEYFRSEFETGQNEYGYELSPEFEFNNEYSGESAYELSPEFEFEFENPQLEMYESGIAQELMGVSNEAEFSNWLRKIAKGARGGAARFLSSAAGRRAASLLRNIAKKTLPVLGSKAGQWADKTIGDTMGADANAEPMGMPEDAPAAEFEGRRIPAFIKFARDAVEKMSNEFESGRPPAIKAAVTKAAAKHYPIILKVKGTLSAKPYKPGPNGEFEYGNELYEETYNETSTQGEIGYNEGTFTELTEMELASELLSVQNEYELDQFLGKLFKKAVGGISKFAKSATGKALGGMLKGIAKKALPIAGGALGTFVAPGIGTAVGGALGSAASNLFELELEGLSAEDREFELSKAFVRFAGNAARRGSRMGNKPPGSAARQAIMRSARQYAPGLLIRDQRNYDDQNGRDDGNESSGTWYREGNRIVIEGA